MPTNARQSPAQRELLLLTAQHEAASLAYSEAVVLRLQGPVDADRLHRVIQTVLDRHPMLRATFRDLESVTFDGAPPTVEVVRPLAVDPAHSADARRRAVEVPYDLEQGPLVRATLLVRPEGCELWLAAHHAVCDGWSFGVLLDEMARAYLGDALGEVGPLPSVTDTDTRDAALEYWRAQLTPVPEPLALPLDAPRPSVRPFASARIDHALSAETAAALRSLAAETGVGLFAVLEAATAAWLSRLTAQDELIVGIATAGQAGRVGEDPVGHAVHVLPRKHSIDGQVSFRTLLAATQRSLLDALEHSTVSFGELLQVIPLPRDPARAPLVQVLLNLDQRFQLDSWQRAGLSASIESLPRVADPFELFLNIVDTGDTLVIETQFATALFDHAMMHARLEGFEVLLDALTRAPETPVGRLPLLTAAAHAAQRDADTVALTTAPTPTAVETLVQRCADTRGDVIAIEDRTTRVDYASLSRRAARVAAALHRAGVMPGARLGIAVSRSADLPILVLGCLAAGVVFVPLDPEAPAERLAFCADDADVAAILTSWPERFRGRRVITPDALVDADGDPSADGPSLTACPLPDDAPAYVQYTSGTTGTPKGVVVPRGALVRCLAATAKTPGVQPGDRWLALTALTFDIAILELLLPLTVGATVVIAPEGTAASGAQLADALADGITVAQATPSTWRLLLASEWRAGAGLRLWTGGEAITESLATALRSTGAVLWNVYGPTEATIWCTAGELTAADRVCTVGRLLPGLVARICSASGDVLPVGVPGTLWIGGAQVATGYLHRDELTLARFREPTDGDIPCRWYDTGDIAMRLVDGRLRILGRADEQVKLRGHRIELGEIEAAARSVAGVQDATAALVPVAEGDDRLVLWVVVDVGAKFDADAIRLALAARLPTAMVPAYIVRTAVLPTTSSGKRDRRALVASFASRVLERPPEVLAPADETEQVIARLAADILRVPRVGRDTDFFSLGGHSLLVAQWQQRVATALQVPLSLRDVLESPTVSGVALRVAALRAARATVSPLPTKAPDDLAPMSPMQERLWFLQQAAPDSAVYSLPAAWWLRGEITDEALDDAFTTLVARQPSLRTVIVDVDGEPRTRVLAAAPVRLQREIVAGETSDARRAAAVAAARVVAQQPLPLHDQWLWRAAVYVTDANERLLTFTVHHVVFDGRSFDILLSDLDGILRGAPLPPLAHSPADVAVFQRTEALHPGRSAAVDRWRTRLEGADPTIALVTDHPRGVERGGRAAQIPVSLDAALSGHVRRAAAAAHTTPFVVLAAAFARLLTAHSGQEEVCLGTPVHGRWHESLDGIIGFFVNTVVLRCRVGDARTGADLLADVHRRVQDALADDDVPFDVLARTLKTGRDPARTPLYGAFFSYQDISRRSSHVGALALEQVILTSGATANDLHAWWRDDGVQIAGAIEYDSTLFDAWRIEAMVAQYVAIIRELVETPDRTLARSLTIGPADEQRRASLRGPALAPTSLLASIAAHVDATPQAIAVRAGDDRVSYATLWAESGAIAAALRGRGVGVGDVVGLVAQRDVRLPTAVLALLRAGVTMLPLDAELPPARLRECLQEADEQLRVLVGHTLPDEAVQGLRAVPTTDFATLLAEGAALAPPADSAIPPDAPAYLLFTSGSTGSPKGVVVPRAALDAFLSAIPAACALAPTDVLGAITTISFDIALLELLLPLCSGACVAVAEREVIADGRALADWMRRHAITVLQATPTSWRLLLDDGWSGALRLAITGGERLPRRLADQLLSRATAVRNMYGPTETTIWSTWAPVLEGDETPPIGSPLPGTWCRVVDASGIDVPPGAAGELLIGGRGVASGYRGLATLTAERFPELEAEADERPSRVYRTGDLVRQRADGALEFLGRRDRQVKVRGHRIELSEVERVVAQLPGVSACVADVRTSPDGHAELCVWIVASPDATVTGTAVRRWVRGRLPSAMVPTHVVALDALPTMANGKVDVRRLSDPRQAAATPAVVAPGTVAEQQIAQVWGAVLGHAVTNVHQTFFDAGGHSLLMLRVADAMRKTFGRRPPISLLVTSTLRELAVWASAEAPLR